MLYSNYIYIYILCVIYLCVHPYCYEYIPPISHNISLYYIMLGKDPLLTVFAGPVREPLLRSVWRGAPSQQGIQAPQLGYKRLHITFEMI